MNLVLDLFVPALLVLLMLVVGLGLTGSDFQRVRNRKAVLFLATSGQAVLLPLLAAGLIRALEPPPQIAVGLILVAASPGGALSNYYAHLARADTAFSVVLSALASLASPLTLPLATYLGFALLGNQGPQVSVPAFRILLQLVLFVLLPVTIGLTTRAHYPSVALRWLPTLNKISLAALIGVLALVFANQATTLSDTGSAVVLLALLFTISSLALGATLGWLLRLDARASASLVLEFPVRNLGIMALVAVTALGHIDFLLFGAVFLVVQLPLCLLATRLLLRLT